MNLGELRENIAQTWKDLPDSTEIILDTEADDFQKVENMEDNVAIAYEYSSPSTKKPLAGERLGKFEKWQLETGYWNIKGERPVIAIRMEKGMVDEITYKEPES